MASGSKYDERRLLCDWDRSGVSYCAGRGCYLTTLADQSSVIGANPRRRGHLGRQ